MGSTWGNQLKIAIFGESHGKGVGVVIDGFPAGFPVDMDFILAEMGRRAPGSSPLTTQRKEKDLPELQSGVLDGITTGAPICAFINNRDAKSSDYPQQLTIPRPSHSDYSGHVRYRGHQDIRGGGHFSGRLTAPLVFAGALCKDYLRKKENIVIGSHLYSIGEVQDEAFDAVSVTPELLCQLQEEKLPVLKAEIADKIQNIIEEARQMGDSIGGVIECAATGLAPGIGSPMFGGVESKIASLVYGIPAVKGVEFGMGFKIAEKTGSQVNDCFVKSNDTVKTRTNCNGGVLGGITTGMPLVLRVAFKPTPSIRKEQHSLNLETGEQEKVSIQGRHDPCIALRCPVIVESAVALSLMDLYMEAKGYEIGSNQR